MLVGLECFCRLVPDAYVDTMGAPFTYALFRLLCRDCRTIAYVHYPLISSDMLQRVQELRPSYNNNASISGSTTASTLKVAYYRMFAWLYGVVGQCAEVVYVNSSWTEGHVAQMWGLQRLPAPVDSRSAAEARVASFSPSSLSGGAEGTTKSLPRKMQDMSLEDVTADIDSFMSSLDSDEKRQRDQAEMPAEVQAAVAKSRQNAITARTLRANVRYVRKLFPPCSTEAPSKIPINALRDGRSADVSVRASNTRFVLSVGQFRPEKDHLLQLRAFSIYCAQHFDARLGAVTLVLLGSTRNTQDEQLVQQLRAEAGRLGLGSRVKFVLNAPFVTLQAWLAAASVGLHTMWNEHFGISVVEMMAAGLIVVAHDRGGPKCDIITPPLRPAPDSPATAAAAVHTGYLATTAEEYAEKLSLALADGETMPMPVPVPQASLATAGGGKAASPPDNAVRLRARMSVQQRFSDEAFLQRVQEDFSLML